METGPELPGESHGLTSEEALSRAAQGRANVATHSVGRTTGDIVRSNVLTRFNALLGSLLLVVLAFRIYRDALFGFVLLSNTVVGIGQELRAKRTLDSLSLLQADPARVYRDGVEVAIAVEAVVEGDLLLLAAGDQVVVDGPVLTAVGLEVDESLLTGESDPIARLAGEWVRSGSIVVGGSGTYVAENVGDAAYSNELAAQAKRFSLSHSELRAGIDVILKVVSWVMIPTAALLVSSQVLATDESLQGAVQGSVAGLIAMVPEGLVLLTSIAFVAGVVRLGRRRVLTQELSAIELLARVDVVCMDKTGTITAGGLVLNRVELVSVANGAEGREADADGADGACEDDAGADARMTLVREALGALAANDDHPNPSMAAVREALGGHSGWVARNRVVFSSERKWSAVEFEDRGTWILGAPDVVLAGESESEAVLARVEELASAGERVLLLALSANGIIGEQLPGRPDPIGLVVLSEQIRPDAADTVEFFAEQGVRVIVISGDHPATVGAVSARVGVDGASRPFDARRMPSDMGMVTGAMSEHSVFGRVTPEQKRQMVKVLQDQGHTVAMTGDGVNDVLALKDADVGVAMGNGSPASRAVAQFVLMDSTFDVFPQVVAEGRRVIANVERVSNLFLTKTMYAMVLVIVVGIAQIPFPFLPRHLTVIGSLTIGVPGFFLALAPNSTLYRPGFLERVLRFAVPAGLVAGAATLVAYQVARSQVPLDEARTVATAVLFTVAFVVLARLAHPVNGWRVALLASMVGGFLLVLAVPALREFFELPIPVLDRGRFPGIGEH